MTTKTTAQKLNEITTGTAAQLRQRAEADRKNRAAIRLGQQFVLKILDYMDDHGIKKKDLAALMGVSPQQVTKIFKARNLTQETQSNVLDALGLEVEFKLRKKQSSWWEDLMNIEGAHLRPNNPIDYSAPLRIAYSAKTELGRNRYHKIAL
jgi:plasmid maintenance system antidote protein VapI